MADPNQHFQFARDNINLEGFDGDVLGRLSALSRDVEALTGRPLQVTSGFRSNEEQKVLYDNYKAGKSKYPAAAPGKSRHNAAGAIDADSAQLNAAAKAGLLEKHGFHRPVKGDPVHLESIKRPMEQPAQPQQQPSNALPPLQDVTAETQRLNLGAQALQRISDSFNDITRQAETVLKGSASDKANVVLTEELAAANAQTQAHQFATNIGLNADANNFALLKLVEDSNKFSEQQRAIADRIAYANDPKQMFNNPLRWLADYLLEPMNQKKHAAVTSKVESTNKQIKFLNDTAQEYRQTQDNIAMTKTSGTAVAAANLAAASITMEQAKLRADALRFNSQGIIATADMQNNAFSLGMRARDQVLQEQQIEIQRTNQKMHAEQLALQLADKKQGQEARKTFLDTFNLGAQNLGMNQFGSYDEMEIFLNQNPAFKSNIAIAYNNGFAQTRGTPPTIAATPVDAMAFAVTSGAKLDPSRAALVKKLQTMAQEVRDDPTTREAASKKETGVITINTGIAAKFTMAHKDITARGDSNPYKAPPLTSLLEDPQLAKTYWGTQILAPLQRAGTTELPFTRAISMLTEDVKAGKLSADQASSELVFFGAKIKAMNNDLYRYYATAGVPNQTQVNVPVSLPKDPGPLDLLGQALIIGYGDSTEVKRFDISDPNAVHSLMYKVKATTLKQPPPSASGKVGVQ